MAGDGSARVCVLGSINVDLVVRSPRLPAPGETVLGGVFERHAGGKGANQCVAAARFGAAAAMVARVGDDDEGRWMRGVLSREHVDVAGVVETSGSGTGVALITVAGSEAGKGENTIVVAPGANALLARADAEAARPAILHADALLMSLEVPLETVLAAAEVARECGTSVVLNAAPARELPIELVELLDVLIVNEVEALGVTPPATDARDDRAALARFWSLPVPVLVMTQGARGVCVMSRGTLAEVGAHAVDVVDTVGSGDAFVGVFASRLAEHRVGSGSGELDDVAILDAACWANAAGALAATRAGAIPSMPTRAEIVSMLRASALGPGS